MDLDAWFMHGSKIPLTFFYSKNFILLGDYDKQKIK